MTLVRTTHNTSLTVHWSQHLLNLTPWGTTPFREKRLNLPTSRHIISFYRLFALFKNFPLKPGMGVLLGSPYQKLRPRTMFTQCCRGHFCSWESHIYRFTDETSQSINLHNLRLWSTENKGQWRHELGDPSLAAANNNNNTAAAWRRAKSNAKLFKVDLKCFQGYKVALDETDSQG